MSTIPQVSALPFLAVLKLQIKIESKNAPKALENAGDQVAIG